jgi:hypothetical protein
MLTSRSEAVISSTLENDEQTASVVTSAKSRSRFLSIVTRAFPPNKDFPCLCTEELKTMGQSTASNAIPKGHPRTRVLTTNVATGHDANIISHHITHRRVQHASLNEAGLDQCLIEVKDYQALFQLCHAVRWDTAMGQNVKAMPDVDVMEGVGTS